MPISIRKQSFSRWNTTCSVVFMYNEHYEQLICFLTISPLKPIIIFTRLHSFLNTSRQSFHAMATVVFPGCLRTIYAVLELALCLLELLFLLEHSKWRQQYWGWSCWKDNEELYVAIFAVVTQGNGKVTAVWLPLSRPLKQSRPGRAAPHALRYYRIYLSTWL